MILKFLFCSLCNRGTRDVHCYIRRFSLCQAFLETYLETAELEVPHHYFSSRSFFFPSNASQKISPAAVFSSPPLPNTQTQPTAHRFLLSRLYFFFSRPLVFPAVCKCIAVRTRTHTAHGASVLVVILTSSRNRITGRGPLGAEESVKSDCFGRFKK